MVVFTAEFVEEFLCDTSDCVVGLFWRHGLLHLAVTCVVESRYEFMRLV